MKQIVQDLKSGATILEEVPVPVGGKPPQEDKRARNPEGRICVDTDNVQFGFAWNGADAGGIRKG